MNAVNGVNPNALRVIAFISAFSRMERRLPMSAFERALAIADEEILDLARALLATQPEHILAQTNRILRLCRSR